MRFRPVLCWGDSRNSFTLLRGDTPREGASLVSSPQTLTLFSALCPNPVPLRCFRAGYGPVVIRESVYEWVFIVFVW